MATTTRSVYFVFDADSDAQGRVFSDLGLIEFANLGRASDWTIIKDVDGCIAVLEVDGWTIEKNNLIFSE